MSCCCSCMQQQPLAMASFIVAIHTCSCCCPYQCCPPPPASCGCPGSPIPRTYNRQCVSHEQNSNSCLLTAWLARTSVTPTALPSPVPPPLQSTKWKARSRIPAMLRLPSSDTAQATTSSPERSRCGCVPAAGWLLGGLLAVVCPAGNLVAGAGQSEGAWCGEARHEGMRR